ncbi:MAG: GAF domain-containing sensor histidine kinase [Winogradskyella sp.]|jgi:signal transduction histidine kinase
MHSEKDKTIERQIRFQKLLISIITTYINADISDIDLLINKSLKQIGEFVESDRSYIFSYDFINNTTTNTYEWCADGITPEIDNLKDIPVDYIPQWLEEHRKGRAFWVEDVSKLPDDGEFGLKAILEPQGIKSLITIPMILRNELIGFIGFDSVRKLNKYNDNEKEILFVYANMLVNLRQKKEYEERIKAQEAKKQELLDHLFQQNKSLSEYAHMVSHDLKAPLINIHTLVSWFIDDNKDKFTEKECYPLQQVLFNAEKMDLLIKGVLDYSTIDRVHTENSLVDINKIIEEVLQTMLIPEHISFNINNNIPTLFGNRWRFRQIFQNLILNAVKYSDKENGKVEVGFTEDEDHYQFFVKDNGVGINPDYFQKIFKVFAKLENSGSSSGIGLSIVEKIVKYYKGNIWVESEEGAGTTFYFNLPKSVVTKPQEQVKEV